jgi:hypothetical protein
MINMWKIELDILSYRKEAALRQREVSAHFSYILIEEISVA